MKIVADKAIPYARRFFSTLGEVVPLDSKDITPESVRDADCLVIRSVTRVDEHLLNGSRVKCVASNSSGTDHVDTGYLDTRAVPLFNAKGCNANSVAEYVLSCLFVLSEQFGIGLEGKTAGIIGCGHVGARLRSLLHVTGMETQVYDPFIRDENGRFVFRDLDSVLSSDIITLHVPLTTAGEYPSAHMVDRQFLGRLKNDVIFVNTARGGVVNERDLVDFARDNGACRLVLDVWDNEPDINDELFALAALATPHIAGYSAQARLNATRRVYEQVCGYFDVDATAAVVILADEDAELNLSGFDGVADAVRTAVLASYDVRSDCAALKGLAETEPHKRGAMFNSLRTEYPSRREFPALRVALSDNQGVIRETLSALGFSIKPPPG
ncbi:MAG: 4-phosphoerythronate dehydrogenase [Gammaproteobacteria bacterium]|nr:4-phosphoerythronate dehydrogenase [Gammaproteobacteria bacterium]